MKLLEKTIVVSFLLLLSVYNFAYDNNNPTPTLERGAEVFSSYCILCHGARGEGDGILPLNISDYPDTNLRGKGNEKKNNTLLETIIYGGILKDVSTFMPPYGNELSWSEVESVAKFVVTLQNDTDQALALLDTVSHSESTSLRNGSRLFSYRCALCHGEVGEGDGRMAKVIRSPPPADLTASRVPDDYLTKIIMGGGVSVNRSPQMPPWQDELNSAELNSIIIFIKSIRD
ncbi:c-type cytochrome [Aurantivibrio infirmus]